MYRKNIGRCKLTLFKVRKNYYFYCKNNAIYINVSVQLIKKLLILIFIISNY